MRAVPGWSLCLPDDMTSNCCEALPSHAAMFTGTRLSRKSPVPEVTERHWPSAVLIAALENARVAVSSRTWASATAAASSLVRVSPAGGAAAAVVAGGAAVASAAVVAATVVLAGGAGAAGAPPPMVKSCKERR
jgi:hypothetical protein